MQYKYDADFTKLFQWAIIKHISVTKKLPATYTPEVVVRLLSVEGLRDELKLSEVKQEVPVNIATYLRNFRKLNQKARLSRATHLFSKERFE